MTNQQQPSGLPKAVRVRITKDPSVRREELLDAALALCRSDGFDALRVDQIVKSAGVAKGTFYHYFAAKDDVLQALVQRFGDALFDELVVAANTPGNPTQRLQAVMNAAAAFKAAHGEAGYASYLYRSDNLVLRHRVFAAWRNRAAEVLLPVITDGLADGSFTAINAVAATDIVLLLWFDAADQLLTRALGCGDAEGFAEIMLDGARQIYQAQERVLGLRANTFNLPTTPELVELTKQVYQTLDRNQP